MWWKKKTKEIPQALDAEELSFQQLGNLFQNVTWAREQISNMLDAIACHQDNDHDCPIYCIPTDMSHFLLGLPPEAVLILLQVALKDSVVWEDTEDSDSEEIS